jgi:excinuclease ABC subunit B
MYADSVTPQMQEAIDETDRRRVKQAAYNERHGITAKTIEKAIRRGIELELKARKTAREAVGTSTSEPEFERDELITRLEKEMYEAAERLEFERAAELRNAVAELRAMPDYGSSDKVRRSDVDGSKPRAGGARSKTGITSTGRSRPSQV